MSIIEQLSALPAHSGVYLFANGRGRILYVGKAKSLRHRVRSYFQLTKKNHPAVLPNPALDQNKQHMVQQIYTIDTISTDTEIEALVLEANLIHQHQPPYNVLLRDDKFYLFIKITTNENPPRVFPVRQLKRDGARYFGPYSSAAAVRQTLYLLRRIFPHHSEKEFPRDKTFPHPLFDQWLSGANQAPTAPSAPPTAPSAVLGGCPPAFNFTRKTSKKQASTKMKVPNMVRYCGRRVGGSTWGSTPPAWELKLI